MTHDSGFAVPAATALRGFDHGIGEQIVIITAMALFIVVQIVVGSIVWSGVGIAWLLGKRG